MLETYNDIRSRIPEPPKWFDEHGVPRYDSFHPDLSPNVYADQVLLYRIACQNCNSLFLVEENWSRCNPVSFMRGTPNPSLEDRVRLKRIHYGDPPCTACDAGATMNCVDLITVQFWHRMDGWNWVRIPELEGVSLGYNDEENEDNG
jgi:hypothetical protein